MSNEEFIRCFNANCSDDLRVEETTLGHVVIFEIDPWTGGEGIFADYGITDSQSWTIRNAGNKHTLSHLLLSLMVKLNNWEN